MKNSKRLAAALLFMLAAGSTSAGMLNAVEDARNVLKSISNTTRAATNVGAGAAGRITTSHVGLGTSAAFERATSAATVDQPSTLALFAIAVAWMAANRRRGKID